jgi:hypothetical protein
MKGLWAVAGSVELHAAGCQRPLAETQQSGVSLMRANADGEPEKVLQSLSSWALRSDARRRWSKYS